jgi:anti-sigma regulatory factor (Ser/Thr protein kinase)
VKVRFSREIAVNVEPFQKRINANLKAVSAIGDEFYDYCSSQLADNEENSLRIIDLKIALIELLNNIVLHACGGDGEVIINLKAKFMDDRLQVTIFDDGILLPQYLIHPDSIHSPLMRNEDLPEKGFGWFLVHQVFEITNYQRNGNQKKGQNILNLIEHELDFGWANNGQGQAILVHKVG